MITLKQLINLNTFSGWGWGWFVRSPFYAAATSLLGLAAPPRASGRPLKAEASMGKDRA